ncbi:MAG TPA: PadR family transcriptional regulator [Rhodanobacter sp.]|nr:PadR family transcriptional regulator [Rhodanobacter sp.]
MRMHHLFHRFAHHHHHGFFMDCEGEHGYHAGRHGPFGEHHGGDAFGGWDGLRGGGRRGGGRMFGHGDLKLLLLALIEQQPRHGYELIRTIEEMFHGQYSPSPGAIYPVLAMLEDMGYAQVESEAGKRKLYAITAEGRAFLDENRAAVDAVTARTEHSARIAAKMAAPMAVRKAMHALKHALLMRTSWDKAEAERVAAILQRAASDIAAAHPHD